MLDGTTAQSRLSWSVSSNGGVYYYAGSNYLDVNFYTATSLQVTLTVTTPVSANQNCVARRTFVIVGSGSCYGGYRREQPSENHAAAMTEQTMDLVDFNIYPNPVKGNEMVLQMLDSGEIPIGTLIKISDLTGKVVYQTALSEASSVIDVQHLYNGIYTISLVNGKSNLSKKLIIQH